MNKLSVSFPNKAEIMEIKIDHLQCERSGQ